MEVVVLLGAADAERQVVGSADEAPSHDPAPLPRVDLRPARPILTRGKRALLGRERARSRTRARPRSQSANTPPGDHRGRPVAGELGHDASSLGDPAAHASSSIRNGCRISVAVPAAGRRAGAPASRRAPPARAAPRGLRARPAARRSCPSGDRRRRAPSRTGRRPDRREAGGHRPPASTSSKPCSRSSAGVPASARRRAGRKPRGLEPEPGERLDAASERVALARRREIAPRPRAPSRGVRARDRGRRSRGPRPGYSSAVDRLDEERGGRGRARSSWSSSHGSATVTDGSRPTGATGVLAALERAGLAEVVERQHERAGQSRRVRSRQVHVRADVIFVAMEHSGQVAAWPWSPAGRAASAARSCARWPRTGTAWSPATSPTAPPARRRSPFAWT